MPGKCCSCTSSGKCLRCYCVQMKRKCVNCTPNENLNCNNSATEIIDDNNISSSECSEFESMMPLHKEASTAPFKWGERLSPDFEVDLENKYSKIIHWRKNIFYLPTGKASNNFIKELTRLYNAYAEQGALERIALTAATTMQILLLQKPSARSKSRDHLKCLERRLKLWNDGNLEDLYNEGKAIQNQLKKSQKKPETPNIPKLFDKLMGLGKIRDAMRLVRGSNINDGVMEPEDIIGNKTVLEVLKEKHPNRTHFQESSLVPPETDECPSLSHPILFEEIDGHKIRKIVMKMHGAGGPSAIDANIWRRFCTGFHKDSEQLCQAIATISKLLATVDIDPNSIKSLTACRLVPLNKNPGVRPIGICEVLRRIISKAILSVTRQHIQNTVGTYQLCAGIESGCEAAVHAINELYNNENSQGILIVDANNAFNSLNREAAILNIQRICPIFSKIVNNMYRNEANLYTSGTTLISAEGTTQGDPLAMPIYALATLPLIKKIASSDTTQVWYADDSAAAGDIPGLSKWWNCLNQNGPQYGYHPNSTKTWLLVKPEFEKDAKKHFKGTGIQISITGRPYLGTPLGNSQYKDDFNNNKILEWCEQLKNLATIAKTQPQASYSAFTHGLRCNWIYALRTIEDLSEKMGPVEEEIRQNLLPTITGRESPTDVIRDLFALPTRNGGLGMTDPSRDNTHFENSAATTKPLVDAILNKKNVLRDVQAEYWTLRQAMQSEEHKKQESRTQGVKDTLPANTLRSFDLASERGASSWLTALPLKEYGFDLHKSAFRDAIHLRYGWKPQNLPTTCTCGAHFDIKHALSCPTGGFNIIRHNETRDMVASLLTEICHNVCVEPSLQPLTGEQFPLKSTTRDDLARVDVKANGLFGGKYDSTFIDIRVVNPLAPSYSNLSISSLYKKQENEKKRKYERRIVEVEKGSFAPFVVSCTGGLAPIATTIVKRMSSMLSEKTETPYSEMIRWVRTRLSFAMIRSSLMCIRGARSKRSRPIHDDPWRAECALSEANISAC